ncbi:hypothetical protein DCCM_2391 [Desulfocucumis palustris]|uniref:Uncharacterized protein n=1 Tax=Desulfocucumis palustris TaxID=1898651 RepID=A0A2L2XB41_9FIRM|nr:hypothetical protein DCCM_2391 [Desulfocucumis palustris]
MYYRNLILFFHLINNLRAEWYFHVQHPAIRYQKVEHKCSTF